MADIYFATVSFNFIINGSSIGNKTGWNFKQDDFNY